MRTSQLILNAGELVLHMQMTARGALPCCAMQKLWRIFSRVVRQFEGLVGVHLDRVVCPGCVITQRVAAASVVSPSPAQLFHARVLRHASHRKQTSQPSAAADALNCQQRSVMTTCSLRLFTKGGPKAKPLTNNINKWYKKTTKR